MCARQCVSIDTEIENQSENERVFVVVCVCVCLYVRKRERGRDMVWDVVRTRSVAKNKVKPSAR